MKDTCLIIARFNEDLDWLNDEYLMLHDMIVYNKGTGKRGIKLPNKGREAHTFLHHINNNYGTLHRHNAFLQGDPFPHVFSESMRGVKLSDDVLKLKQSKLISALMSLPDKYYAFDCHITKAVVSPTEFKRNGARIFNEELSGMIYGWLQRLKPMPAGYVYTITVSHFACFAVTDKEIQSYPLEFWQELLKFSIETEHAPYLIEMLWYSIFNNKDIK